MCVRASLSLYPPSLSLSLDRSLSLLVPNQPSKVNLPDHQSSYKKKESSRPIYLLYSDQVSLHFLFSKLFGSFIGD